MQPEPFTDLSDGVGLWVGDLDRHEQTNVGIIRGGDSIVVIDANFEWAATRILAGIREREQREVSHVVNTHYHVDHTLGNPVFADAGATIIGAAGQRRELLEKGPEDAMIQVGKVPDRWSPATLEFTGSISFPDSKLELMAVGPAHTEADVVAWLPEDRIVFVGDLAVAWAHGNNFSDVDADMEGWILALSRCIALRPRIVVPAHGRVAGVEVLLQQRDFTEELWAWGLDAAASGQEKPTEAEVTGFVERHPEFAVSPERFAGMARSMLEAARRTHGSSA
jgi:cyclase